MGSMSSCGFSCFTVILNAVKNLSERGGGGAIVDGRAIPEILRFTQDDKGIAKRLASSRIEAERSAETQKKYPATSVAG